ncbi:hypothetical protein ACFQE1_19020, partial [Halobium palmae]
MEQHRPSASERESMAGPTGLDAPPSDSFTDASGRRIDLYEYGRGPIADEFEALVGLYREFDPRYRSDGIPPATESGVRAWVARLSRDHCTVAWHDA